MSPPSCPLAIAGSSTMVTCNYDNQVDKGGWGGDKHTHTHTMSIQVYCILNGMFEASISLLILTVSTTAQDMVCDLF